MRLCQTGWIFLPKPKLKAFGPGPSGMPLSFVPLIQVAEMSDWSSALDKVSVGVLACRTYKVWVVRGNGCKPKVFDILDLLRGLGLGSDDYNGLGIVPIFITPLYLTH